MGMVQRTVRRRSGFRNLRHCPARAVLGVTAAVSLAPDGSPSVRGPQTNRRRNPQAMKIGIFSKCGNVDGSEFRCAELANGIVRYTEHQPFLLCEGMIHPKVLRVVDDAVAVRLNVMSGTGRAPVLYEMDAILVVNTDSNEFTDLSYWRGRTYRHSCVVDLTRIKRFVFLFNFTLEPAAQLPSLFGHVGDVRLITANTQSFNLISRSRKYQAIRHLPRLVLASPIDPEALSTGKKPSERIRIGQYAMPRRSKFNEEIGALVTRINDRYPDRVAWHFMGMPDNVAGLIAHHPNVVLRAPFAVSVKEFLSETDIFLYYPVWERSEPWARSVAEALMSGCPVLATSKGGNRDQIVHGNNGYLCGSLGSFVRYLSGMIERPELITLLGDNAALNSTFFSTQHVISALMEFIR